MTAWKEIVESLTQPTLKETTEHIVGTLRQFADSIEQRGFIDEPRMYIRKYNDDITQPGDTYIRRRPRDRFHISLDFEIGPVKTPEPPQ